MPRRVVIPLIVLVVGVVAFIIYFRHGAEPVPSGLRVSGNVEVTEVSAAFQTAGRVESISADEGDLVRAGDTIARLEETELSHQLAVAEAAWTAAAAQLHELEAGSLGEEKSAAEAILESALAEEKRLADDRARMSDLFDKQVIARRDLDATEAAHDVARARVREARERLALVRKGPRAERIALSRAQVEQALQSLNLARTRLGFTVLYSPLSGLVLTRTAESGEFLAAGAPVLSIGDLEHPWLRAFVDETDLGRVRVGQRARVFVDAFRDRAFDGRISFISAEAEFTPRTVQTEKERVKLVYRIKIDVDNLRMVLKPGMPAEAEIDGTVAP